MIKYILLIFGLLSFNYIHAQLSDTYLLDKWVCYKETTGDGNPNSYNGTPYDVRTDTLEFLPNNKLIVYNGEIEITEYNFVNAYLFLGNQRYIFNIIDIDKYYIQSKSDFNMPDSWEFRYYFVRLDKANTIEKVIATHQSIDSENFLFGKWVKYREGNSRGDSIQLNGTQFTLHVDTLEFVPPDKIIIKEKFKPTVETSFLKVMTLIGWNKDSHSYGIIDKDHFFLDDFNPNYPEPVVRRHYYRRIE